MSQCSRATSTPNTAIARAPTDPTTRSNCGAMASNARPIRSSLSASGAMPKTSSTAHCLAQPSTRSSGRGLERRLATSASITCPWVTRAYRTPCAEDRASANTGQLACFAEDDDRVSDGHGRLGPAAMVGTFELVAAHLAFHRTRVGTQPPLGDPLSNDLGDRPPDRPGDLVRGKTPRGWPGDDARSAACPQTTAGRGPSPRPG